MIARTDFMGCDRWLPGLMILLSCTFVQAQSRESAENTSALDDLHTQVIAESAGDWRKPTEDEDKWRAPAAREPMKEMGRITWGYDTAYEDKRVRLDDETVGLKFQNSDSNPKPSNLFRVRF